MIDYEALAQDAMRGVVRTVLSRTAKNGLPGDHHFYISFDTQAPGIGMSKRLKEKYPDEMTIVLQHRFWDLAVSEDRFEVKLTFDGIPERLVVPFAALKVFFDPSVRYGLQFEAPEWGPHAIAHPHQGQADPTPSGTQAPSPFRGAARSPAERKPRSPRKPRVERPAEAGTGEVEAARPPAAASPRSPQVEEAKAGPAAPAPAVKPAVAATHPTTSSGAEIVSLDAFRKK